MATLQDIILREKDYESVSKNITAKLTNLSNLIYLKCTNSEQYMKSLMLGLETQNYVEVTDFGDVILNNLILSIKLDIRDKEARIEFRPKIYGLSLRNLSEVLNECRILKKPCNEIFKLKYSIWYDIDFRKKRNMDKDLYRFLQYPELDSYNIGDVIKLNNLGYPFFVIEYDTIWSIDCTTTYWIEDSLKKLVIIPKFTSLVHFMKEINWLNAKERVARSLNFCVYYIETLGDRVYDYSAVKKQLLDYIHRAKVEDKKVFIYCGKMSIEQLSKINSEFKGTNIRWCTMLDTGKVVSKAS